MDAAEQQRALAALARAAREEGCLVAPVGSVYFLLRGAPRTATKDLDAVIHAEDLRPPGLAVLLRIAARLEGYAPPDATADGAVVQLRRDGQETAEIELIRGRPRAKGGFFPRELLLAAAKEARRESGLLVYPIEFILVLKADAAIDREDRAKKDTARAPVHERRATAFRADVLREVNAALLADGLSARRIEEATSCLKAGRRARVRQLLVAAGVDLAGGTA